jgi:hypothetical protein
MKKIVYRLKFRFEESNDKSDTRNDRLNSILSSMEDIDTENPIKPPQKGSIIEVDGEVYEVTSQTYSFLTEGDMVFYTTIVGLVNVSAREARQKSENDLMFQRMKDMLLDDRKGKDTSGFYLD